jgi:hypothetical protein
VAGSQLKGKIWRIREGIRPVDFYVYLKARFGEPNGIQSLLRKNDSDNLIHWHYHLRYHEHKIDILGMSFRIEIFAPPLLNHPDAKTAFISDVKDDFRNYAEKMGKIRKELESWDVFVNPFYRIKISIESQLSELDELELDKLVYPSYDDCLRDSGSNEIQGLINNYHLKFDKASRLCLNIKLLLPIYAEAFINFLIFALCKSELRNDKRLYDNFVRQNIDVRIKSLHLHCNSFQQPVDYELDICKQFHTFINTRNDLIHGNIDPKMLLFDQVNFDNKTIPLFHDFYDYFHFSVRPSLQNLEPTEIMKDYEMVQDFLTYVVICLEYSVGQEMLNLSQKRELGWNQKTGRLGILFPNIVVDFAPVFSPGDDAVC